MPLRFRNIDASPADPVERWGFEGMLAAIDRGYARDWRKLVESVAADPRLRPEFDEALLAAESTATARLLTIALNERTRTVDAVALDRLRDAFHGTRMSQGELAHRLGTSRSRVNTYLTGQVTPSMSVLAAVEQLAAAVRGPSAAVSVTLL